MAKLMTRVDRKMRTTPTAMTPYVRPVTAPDAMTWGGKPIARRPDISAPEEHGAGEVVACRQLGGRALESDLALLHEQGAVGDRQGHVERLLDDDHGQAGLPEPLDHLEHLLHD